MKMANLALVQLIRRWHAVAGSHSMQPMAQIIWPRLEERLEPDDLRDLKLAWMHFVYGEGREELDKETYRVVAKVSNDD